MIKYHEKPRSWSAAFARWVSTSSAQKCLLCDRTTYSTFAGKPMHFHCAREGGYID